MAEYSRLTAKPLTLRAFLYAMTLWACIPFSSPAYAQPAQPKASATTKPLALSLRGRLAQMEQLDTGQAASYRLRLSWQQPLSKTLEGKVAFDHIATGWQDNHSDGVRFNGMPTIPDAPSTQVNEAWINGHWQALELKIGKQRVHFENQRHLGSNGFWQNEQTFDAAHLNYAVGMSSALQLNYLSKAHRITGPKAGTLLQPSDNNFSDLNGVRPANLRGEHDLKTFAAVLKTTILDFNKLGIYYIDNNNLTAPTLNYRSLGANYQWRYAFGAAKAFIEADLSVQQRSQVSHIPYTRFKGAVNTHRWLFAIEQEQLGSKENTPYITPMASLHDFQGFADQFTTTPEQGVTDNSLQGQYTYGQYKVAIFAHHFTRYSSTHFLGKELDIDIKLPDIKQIKMHFRYAYFWAPTTKADTQRIFLTASITL